MGYLQYHGELFVRKALQCYSSKHNYNTTTTQQPVDMMRVLIEFLVVVVVFRNGGRFDADLQGTF